jgi:hypothetical protein
MERCLGWMIVAALLAGLTACSVAGEKDLHRTNEGGRHETAHRQTTGAPARQEEPTASEETAAGADAPASWDDVALGDSLAVGVGARRGYVDRYAAYIESDTGAHVKVINLGESGQLSSELLYAVRNDESMRRALGAAEVVKFSFCMGVAYTWRCRPRPGEDEEWAVVRCGQCPGGSYSDSHDD